MPKPITKITIFLSSPSDLEEERNYINEVISELNITYGSRNNLIIELIKWETHSGPGISTTYTQNIINEDIGDEYDIFLGLLWKRFGTKTAKYGSGTEEEFQIALSRFEKLKTSPQILLYFKNSSPKSLDEIDPEQFLKVTNFKKSLPTDHLLSWNFDTFENLGQYLRIHIPKRIETLLSHETQNSVETTIQNNEVNVEIIEDDLGIFEYFDLYENLLKSATNSIERIAESTNLIGVQITEKTAEINRVNKLPNTNRQIFTNIFVMTSRIMNDYTKKLEIETPIFYSNFEEAIKAGTNFINLISEFISEERKQEFSSAYSSINTLKESMMYSIDGLSKFYQSINDLPKINTDINIAKRKLLKQFDELLLKLESSILLLDELIKEIELKLT